MNKERKYNLYSIAAAVIVLVGIFVYSEFLCGTSDKCYDQEVLFLEPAFFLVSGLIPTLLILLWRGEIFITWLKHIAWWFIPVVAIMVGSNSNESAFSFFADDVSVVLVSMVVLFVITLIYALIKKSKLQLTHR